MLQTYVITITAMTGKYKAYDPVESIRIKVCLPAYTPFVKIRSHWLYLNTINPFLEKYWLIKVKYRIEGTKFRYDYITKANLERVNYKYNPES